MHPIHRSVYQLALNLGLTQPLTKLRAERNAPCPCGRPIHYKKCHLRLDEEKVSMGLKHRGAISRLVHGLGSKA